MVAKEGSIIRKVIAVGIAKIFKKKTIVHIHSCKEDLFYNDNSPLIKKFLAFFFNINDLILVLSDKWKEIISLKCTNNNIQVLYNPVSIKTISQKDNPESINIMYCGRLEERKGYKDLIKAAEYINNNKVNFYLYGDGETNKAIQLNKAKNINIMGWQAGKTLEKAYLNADIFVLPSYNEGLPMAILEAMSYGLPIISTNVGGIPELITNGVNGFLIEPGDCLNLVNKLNILIENKDLRIKMGEEGLKRIKEDFSHSKIIDQLEQIYLRLDKE